MDIEPKFIQTTKTARYTSYGNLSERTRYFWFAIHGSKMLCEQMIYKFRDFDPDTHFVIAPEALSRYYMTGFGGDVVASWMTSRDRLHEIEDFSVYFDRLYQIYLEQIPSSCKKIVLAFSQGGTTAYRWLHHSKVDLDTLIAYSCWIPEDIDLRASSSNLNSFDSIYTYGVDDEYLTPDKISMVKDVIEKNSLHISIEPYKGDHRISRKQLQYIFKKYIQLDKF